MATDRQIAANRPHGALSRGAETPAGKARSTRSALRRSTSADKGRRAGRSVPFGPPPLIEGEDAAAYDELLTRVSAAIKPADILEDIWVRDIVDFVWNAFRLRRLQANLITASAYNGLQTVLAPLIDQGLRQLVEDWARREPNAIKEVNHILASADLTMDAVMAHTLCENLDSMERIDSMIALAEGRRDAILHEIDRHRATLGHALRRTVEQIEEGEYRVLNTKSIKANNPA
jgi:hypothetical protein